MNRLNEDYSVSGASSKTIFQRLLDYNEIEAIVAGDYMTASTVALVQMTSDTIRGIEAMPITPVQWDSEGGFLNHFKVMSILVPQLRADQEGKMGLVVGTT